MQTTVGQHIQRFARAVLVSVVLLGLCGTAYAATPEYFNQVVDAIYQAEGGVTAQYPYGIRSIPCDGAAACRRICYNTVRNNWRRWETAGRPGDYIDFLGSKYCPTSGNLSPAERRLNGNWIRNVRYFLEVR